VITHVILLEPRADLSDADTRAVLDEFAKAARQIPAVKSCRLGRRVLHGLPGYETLMRSGFEYAAIVEFDDIDGLKAYLTHPAHAAVGRYFTTAAANALAYDYSMVDVDDAAIAEFVRAPECSADRRGV
jgi:Stress responsive A/B Barrel Domain